MRVWSIAIAVVLVTLAGCAENAPAGNQQAFSQDLDEELQATEETGIIRGVVIDDTITPVDGVTVTLTASGVSTTTDADGFFGFADLEPGTYFLQATKLGYSQVQASSTVVAGVDQPPIVRIALSANPSELPYIQADQFDGYIVCSLRAGTANQAGSVGVNACNGVAEQDVGYTHAEIQGNLTAIQAEMVWQSSQQSGDELSLVVGPPNCADVKYARADGPTPLVYRLDENIIAAQELGPDKTVCTRVFTYTSGTLAHLWGMQVEQEFSVFIHHFYNLAPIEGWMFVVDGEHPIPS